MELIDLFPCFAILAPALAATIAELVDIFRVPLLSPPVPHVSTIVPAPRISSFVSDFNFNNIKIADISISEISPFIINLNKKVDSLIDKFFKLNNLSLIFL